MSPAELRAVARLGRRTARREWRRTTLVGLLVAVPVMVGIVTAGLVRANDVTPEERVTADMGRADLRVRLHEESGAPLETDRPEVATMDRLVADVAPDALRFRDGGTLQAMWGLDWARVTDVSLDHPLADGMLTVLDGRAPRADDEVMVSPSLLEGRDLGMGDDLVADDGDSVTIVGTVVDPTNTHVPLVLVTPAAMDDLLDHGRATANPIWVMAAPNDAARVATDLQRGYDDAVGHTEAEQRATELAARAGEDGVRAGIEVPARADVETRESELRNAALYRSTAQRILTPQVVATLVAAVLLAEVALIAGAAYATGARRRLRELGLLGANGATTAHVRAAVVGEATATGVVGGAVGVVAGVVALHLGRPLLQRVVTPLVTTVELSVTDLVGPAIAAVVAVSVAAWLPARTAARVPTTTALEGRMPLSAPRRWIAPAGVVLAAFGGLLLLTGILASGTVGGFMAGLGVLVAIAGAALLTVPMIARLGRWADRVPATLRLVLRDSGRQRTRAAAASASAMVVLISPVLVGTISTSMEQASRVDGLPQPGDHVYVMPDEAQTARPVEAFSDRPREDGAWDRDAALAGVGAVLPDAERVAVAVLDERASLPADPAFDEVTDEGQYSRVADAGTMTDEVAFWNSWGVTEAFVGVADDTLLDVLDLPAVTAAVADGEVVVLGLRDRDTTVALGDRQVDAVEVPASVLRWGFPRVLVPPDVADGLGLSVAGTADLFVAADPITSTQRSAIHRAMDGGEVHVGLSGGDRAALVRWLVVAATLVVALVILALVTMLSATESDHDLRTMVAVGAPPRMRRRFLGMQAGVHALVGAVLAAPLALALAWAAAQANGSGVRQGLFGQVPMDRLWLDWPSVGAVVVGVPAVIAVAIALLVRSATTAPPRRVG